VVRSGSERRKIVPSVREARAGGAEARIVTFATTAEINKALGAGDVHVLHISCHGSAGRLSLEDENGSARPVTARTLVEEAIPPGKMPPVICLSACDTNVTDPFGDLPAVTATNTINLPVAEVQTLTTNSKNPRQN